MHLDNNSNNINTPLFSEIIENKCNYTFIIDTSAVCTDVEFANGKKIMDTFINKVADGSTVSIISYSDTPILFTKDIIKDSSTTIDYSKILYVGGTSKSNLNLALSLPNFKYIQSNNNNYVVIISNGPPDSNPSTLINKMVEGGVETIFICVRAGSEIHFNTIVTQSNIHVYDNQINLIKFINNYTKELPPLPFIYSFYFNDYKIQKSNEILNVSFKIRPSNRRTIFNENEIVITIHQNNYYHGDEVKIESKVEYKTPFIFDFELEPVSAATTKDLPHKIKFDIIFKHKCYSGYFILDLTKLVGDFKTKFPLNIYVDGPIGHGKSSLLNLILNLFTSGQTIQNIIYSSKLGNHTTKKIEYYPISKLLEQLYKEESSPLIEEVIKNINLVLVDKYGMKENEPNISYDSAVKGCYHPDTQHEISLPNKLYECHGIIFVLSFQKISSGLDLKDIKLKISEAINKGLQPTLVLTFSDNLSKSEIEADKQRLNELPIEKENIFFITPYIDNETNRQPAKDLDAWKLLKKVFENSKIAKFNRERFISSVLYKDSAQSSIVGEENVDCKSPNTTTANGGNSSINNQNQNSFIVNVIHNSLPYKFVTPKSNLISDIKRRIKTRYSIDDDIILSYNGCELDGDDQIAHVLSNDANIDVIIKSTI